MKHSVTSSRNNILLFLLTFGLLISSCSKSKDDAVPPQGIAFVGQFIVVEPSETYTLEIMSKGGVNFQVTEFGGFLNAPLKAVLDGNVLKVPSQTFKNSNGNAITITGTGTLSTKSTKDDTVTFNYKVTGFTEYEGEFEGTRK